MEDNTCSMLRAAVKELKEEINRFVDNYSIELTKEIDTVGHVFYGLLDIVHGYYEGKKIGERAVVIELRLIVDNLRRYVVAGNIPKDYEKNKKLYSNALLLWTRTRFLGLIQSRIPYEGRLPSEPMAIKLNFFVDFLVTNITETTDILKDKNDKDNVVKVGKPGFFSTTREGFKQLIGTGRNARYESLLKHAKATGAEATGAEATGAEATGAEATPIFYFLMLYTLGIIAIQLKSKVNETITYKDIREIVIREVFTRVRSSFEAEQIPPESPTPSSSSGGATRRRRRHRRNHSSLHSRKSINRNKKSKKIRKLYTSKHRVRPRNRNKPKNKSRK